MKRSGHHRIDVIRLGPTSWALLIAAFALGVVAFAWPLFASANSALALAEPLCVLLFFSLRLAG